MSYQLCHINYSKVDREDWVIYVSYTYRKKKAVVLCQIDTTWLSSAQEESVNIKFCCSVYKEKYNLPILQYGLVLAMMNRGQARQPETSQIFSARIGTVTHKSYPAFQGIERNESQQTGFCTFPRSMTAPSPSAILSLSTPRPCPILFPLTLPVLDFYAAGKEGRGKKKRKKA